MGISVFLGQADDGIGNFGFEQFRFPVRFIHAYACFDRHQEKRGLGFQQIPVGYVRRAAAGQARKNDPIPRGIRRDGQVA